jgi:hypothetical protein
MDLNNNITIRWNFILPRMFLPQDYALFIPPPLQVISFFCLTWHEIGMSARSQASLQNVIKNLFEDVNENFKEDAKSMFHY